MLPAQVKTLSEIAQKTPTAEAFFTYAACRARNVREGVSRIPAIRAQMTKEGFHPVPQDLLAMFKELEKAGVGQLRGTQFKWHAPIKEIGNALTLKTEPVERRIAATVEKAADGKALLGKILASVTLSPKEIMHLCDRLLNAQH